jgi:DNA-binding NarL/FixJ family response regulator
MIRILLVDDHAVLRSSLGLTLNQYPELSVVAEAGSLAEARRSLSGVDVALLDLDLPDGVGTQIIPEMRAVNPPGAAVVLTASLDQRDYARAIERGATSVLYKAASIDAVVDAIHKASTGQSIHSQDELFTYLRILSRDHERDAQTQRLLAQITPREHDLLRALADGLSDQEIADRLAISVRTVQSHMLNVMEKLDVHSRLQALVAAVRHGLVQISPD